jgi:hypothetical protein
MPRPRRSQRTEQPAQPTDELVLAAIERAARHQARDAPAVPGWAVLEHLDIPRRSTAARRVRERLAAMHQAGWLEHSRRHSVPVWALSSTGRSKLRSARRAGTLAPLPESPQHRNWRAARTAAGQEIERFRADVCELLDVTATLLSAHTPPESDTWLELAEELQHACQRLASASYCLFEWAEPSDAHADIDEHVEPADALLDARERMVLRARRAGRRNIRLWDRGRDC